VDHNEIKTRAEQRITTLNSALAVLATWESASRNISRVKITEAAKLEVERDQAVSDFNRLKVEIKRALAEVEVSSLLNVPGRGGICSIANAFNGYGLPFFKPAISSIESALGEWERILADPARLVKAPQPKDELVPMSEAKTRETAAAPDFSKMGLWWVLRHITGGQWAWIGGAILVVTGAAYKKGLGDADDFKTENKVLRNEVTKLKTTAPSQPTTTLVATSAPGPIPSDAAVSDPRCARFPKFKRTDCIAENLEARQPNLVLGSGLRNDEDRKVLDTERRRLAALFKGADRFEDWSDAARMKIMPNGNRNEIWVTQVDPTAADELCDWLEKCDTHSSLPAELRQCRRLSSKLGPKTCP
jgi:hypothetical protein